MVIIDEKPATLYASACQIYRKRGYMKRIFIFIFFLNCTVFAQESTPLKKYKVGLCVMATGRYDAYARTMIESARKYFLTNQDVTYFIFTNGDIPDAPDVVKVYQERLGWPSDTLKRNQVYLSHKDLYKDFDYLYATDADMLFEASVGDEILSDRVATIHPGYVGRKGTLETKKTSAAYVDEKKAGPYFCGGFFGGTKDEFLKMLAQTVKQIDADLKNNYIAIWHDESHLNRYFFDNKPTLILNPSYCFPEEYTRDEKFPYERKLVALKKNHEEVRK